MVRVLSTAAAALALLSTTLALQVSASASATLTASSKATTTTTTTATTTTSGLKLYGVNYNIRAGADWEPEETKCKSLDVIAQELAKLKTITDTIRLYSLTDCNQAAKVIPLANKAGLKVSLGLWVGPEAATFAAEKLKLEELIGQEGLVTAENTPAIYVGSEALYRRDVKLATAIANVKEIKSLCTTKKLGIPITLADTTEEYLRNPSLIDVVDFASPNVFPFWDKIAADKGPAQLYTKLQRLAKIAKGKDIVIGETGYPTDGVEAKGSKASMENAATYFRGFYELAQKYNLKYYYFAGFDESWKLTSASANSTVEAYFGIFDKDGEIKEAYSVLKPTASTSASASSSASTSTSASGSAGVDFDVDSSSSSSSADAGDDLPTKATAAPVASLTTLTVAPAAAPVATAASPAKETEIAADEPNTSKEEANAYGPGSSTDAAATFGAGEDAGDDDSTDSTDAETTEAAVAGVADSKSTATAAAASKTGSSAGLAVSGKKKHKDCDV